jgi:hypothetical protein
MFTCSSNVNENISNFTKYTQHDFKDEIQNCIFNYVQLHVLNKITCIRRNAWK